MSHGLTHLALRCVVEHLEANKRINIASRSQSFRLAEKSIPLRLEILNFQEYSIKINKLTYSINHNSELIAPTDARYENRPDSLKMMPGDFQIEPAAWQSSFFQLTVKNLERNVYDARIPTGIQRHLAIKTLTSCFLGGRAAIRVDKLRIQTSEKSILRLPVNLKMIVKRLRTSQPFYHFLPLIDPISFPLQKLKIGTKDPEIFKNPIVNSTEQLIIHGTGGRIPPWLLVALTNFPIQKVQIHSLRLEFEDLATIIQSWLQSEREIGSVLKIFNGYRERFAALLWRINERFNFVEEQLPSVDANDGFRCFSTPINSTTKLSLFGKNDVRSVKEVVLKVLLSHPASPAAKKRKTD